MNPQEFSAKALQVAEFTRSLAPDLLTQVDLLDTASQLLVVGARRDPLKR